MKRLVIALFFLAIPYSIAHAALVEQDLVTQISGSTFSVAGKIDTVKHPTFKTFSIKGYLSNVADFKTVIKTDIPPTKAIGNDGTYGWTFTDLTPSTTYYFKQKVSDGKTTEESKVYNTTTTSAAGASAIPATQQDFDSRSYRLLAPFPGLSVLLDPDLCEEQRSQKGKGGEICDINDFLNYMFKLLVSLAAVLLVLRLVYEGYQYIVTDIPFLKASAKSGFFEALGGLALALSAYLILNTINPKLVENSISLNKVAVGVDFEEGGDIPPKSGSVGSGKGGTGYDFKSIKFPAGIICPAKNIGAGTIPTIAQSFKGRVSYSQDARGTAYSSTVINLDCSSYVNTVLSCAGITPKTEAFTGDIFNGTEKIITVENKNGKYLINGIEVKVGDLIGWQAGGAKPYTSGGHVLIYIGDGTLMDVRSSPNPSVGENPIVKWANTRIQKKYSLYIRRI